MEAEDLFFIVWKGTHSPHSWIWWINGNRRGMLQSQIYGAEAEPAENCWHRNFSTIVQHCFQAYENSSISRPEDDTVSHS